MYSTPMLLAAACECLAKAATSSASLPMVLSLASSPVNTLNLSCTCALIIGPPGDCNSSLHRKGWVRDGNRSLVKRGWSRTIFSPTMNDMKIRVHPGRHENIASAGTIFLQGEEPLYEMSPTHRSARSAPYSPDTAFWEAAPPRH